MTKQSVLKPTAARRSRQATIGWEKGDWGGQYATRPDNAFHDGWEKLYHGEEVNEKVKNEWEGIHENSFGHDKRDPLTLHARQEHNRKISKQTRITLEKKAAKALLVAKALLGKTATTESLEDQAAELMDLPTRTLNSTLKRVFAAGEEMTEDDLTKKVEELLNVTEQAEAKAVEVAEAAGVPVPEKTEEKVEEKAPEAPAADMPAEAAPAAEEGANDEGVMSNDEIQGILFGEGTDDKASSVEDNFFSVDSLVGDLFEGVTATTDEVTEIEKKLASNQKQGVKKLVAMTKSESSGNEIATLWKTLPDVSEVFANRRR